MAISSTLRRGSTVSSPDIIEYNPPAYDERKVKAYQQESLAPGISGLRRMTREALAGRYTSPSARREAFRGLARGSGEALASLQAGAGAQARGRYDIQYRQEIEKEKRRVEGEQRKSWMEYQQDLVAEAEAVEEEADRVIMGYNAAGRPIYGTREEAAARSAAIAAEGLQRGPTNVIGLTEASRRPISDEPTYGRSLYPESVGPEPAYPTNWMT